MIAVSRRIVILATLVPDHRTRRFYAVCGESNNALRRIFLRCHAMLRSRFVAQTVAIRVWPTNNGLRGSPWAYNKEYRGRRGSVNDTSD